MSEYISINKTYAPPKARPFVEEIIKVCKKHGFSLRYEGPSFTGDFIISPYNSEIVYRLRNALVEV